MVGVIIQARMGSSRLPGKTMKKILDKPLLFYSYYRSSLAKYVDEVVIATTTEKKDDVIVEWCENNNIKYFRGSEQNVLERYYKAAKKFNFNKIVRVTSDDPFICPELIDLIIINQEIFEADFVCLRNKTNTWPYGLDVEIYDFKALEASYLEASEESEKEHVSIFIRNNPNDFKIVEVPYDKNLSEHRLTIDTEDDFNKNKYLMEKLIHKKGLNFRYKDILEEF